MAKPPKRRQLKKAREIETVSDAWDQFTKAVGKIAPPKRVKAKAGKSSATAVK